MATITANGCHQVAAFTTERVIKGTLYCERWVLRSDGKMLGRIVWIDAQDGVERYYTRTGGRTTRLTHTSGLAVRGNVKHEENRNAEWVRNFLTRKGLTITKEG